MKPRLTVGWKAVWLGCWIEIYGWYCTGDGRTEFSPSLKDAYAKWGEPRPGAIVIQHTYPPKPPFWRLWWARMVTP